MNTLRQRMVPYWLLAPGIIWLALFFVLPMYFMGELSLKTGSLADGYQLTWATENYTDAISQYSTQFFRAFYYAGTATVICLLIGYPLAYAIAFKAGRWKNLMLFAVVAPFFTTYLIRTIAWKTILQDSSPVVECPQVRPPRSPGRAGAGHQRRGDRRPDLQLPALHGPAAVRRLSNGSTCGCSRPARTFTPRPGPRSSG